MIYYGSAGGLAPSPGWVVEAFQDRAWLGISVGTAGDVNGDGFADVIVGASNYDQGEADEGCVFVYLGFAAGVATTPAWTGETNEAEAGFIDWTFCAATAGDVNGDGFSDVIFGSSRFNGDLFSQGKAWLYHGGPDGLPPFPAWFTNGGQTGAGWGYSVATAGDVNGDGYSDVIAVADRYDSGEADEGKAWLFLGTPGGLSTTPNWSAETNQLAAQISCAASAGDVNGDGYSDVILGSYHYDNGQSDEGRTYLYLGSPSGLNGSPSWISEPDQAGAEFGWVAGTAGDVNGDGFSDVIVGAPSWDNTNTYAGKAWVYLGSSGGLGGPAWSAEGDQYAFLGYAAGTAGDINADGYSDVLVGLPLYSHGESQEGVVWVFNGSPSGLAATPSRILEANQAGASFGFETATAGDVNGDGYSDVIVGATSFDNGQTDEGRAFVYHGGPSGLSSLPVWTTEPDQTSGNLGWTVATAGDVNGDGFSDVLVGSPMIDSGETDEGKVWLYHGSPSGLGGPVWTTEGGQTGALFGSSLGTAGDVNGDGFSDVVIGAFGYNYSANDDGAIWLFQGNQGDGLHRIRRQLRMNQSTPIDQLCASDAESGFRVQALARTPAGRAKVRLQVEVKPAGTPFDGTGLVTGPFVSTGYPSVDGSAVSLIQSLAGLAPGTIYHWRVRFVTDAPLFPRSPWLWTPYNGVNEGDVRTKAASEVAENPVASPQESLLGPAAPNPFAGSTTLSFALPRSARVRLSVFDAQGRRVAEVLDEAKPAGSYAVRWNGQDAEGRALPAGAYFVRLETEGHLEARKVIMVADAPR